MVVPASSPLPTLAVTGSTGALGGLVARHLADEEVPLRLLARSPERAPALPGAHAVRAAYGDRDAALLALDGVQTSSRYPAGMALRFARVLRYRDDKTAAEADTVDAVRILYGS